jgi:FkbM family methyltransferase
LIKYFGFEPDVRSNDNLNNIVETFLDYKIFPTALSETKKNSEFYLCKKPEVSSLYKPNTLFLKNFSDKERFSVINKQTLKTVSLDSYNIKNNDFVKIDVQGSELNILKGANKTLEKTFGLELEIEFLELYKDQPLFGEVCKKLAEKGFQFIDFVNLVRWERKEYNSFGQCVFGDALFLKTPEVLDIKNMDKSKICTYLAILIIYKRYDLVDSALDMLDEKLKVDFFNFELAFKKEKKRNKFIRNLLKTANKIAPFLGNNYRFHLIY